jgi:hypothetical protein
MTRRPAKPHRLRTGFIAALLGIAALSLQATPSAAADRARLLLERPEWRQGELYLDFTLTDIFDAEVREALAAGLPATLAFRWQLWEERAVWPDRGLETGGTWVRINFDVLEKRYDLFDETGRRVAGCASLAEVDASLCREQGLRIDLPGNLSRDRRYHIRLEARLEPLNVNQIRDLEAWLEGEGDESVELGISDYAVGVLKDMTGMGSRGAQARSASFSGRR